MFPLWNATKLQVWGLKFPFEIRLSKNGKLEKWNFSADVEAQDRSPPRNWLRIRSNNCLPEGPIISDFRISIFFSHFCRLEVDGIFNFWWKINFKNGKFLPQNLEYYENPQLNLDFDVCDHRNSDLQSSTITDRTNDFGWGSSDAIFRFLEDLLEN